MSDSNIKLTDCIGPAFYDVHYDIEEKRHTYYDLTGGRGSLKSSVISLEILLNMIKPENREKHAVIYRKVETPSKHLYIARYYGLLINLE